MKKNVRLPVLAVLILAISMLKLTSSAYSQSDAYAAKVPHPDKGKAVIVHFYMGEDMDNSWTRLVQAIGNPIADIFEGYKYKVLLMHEAKFGSIKLDEKAVKAADLVDIPTQSNLFKYIKKLTGDGYTIDLFILSHGKNEKFVTSAGTMGSEDWCEKEEIEDNLNPASSGFSFIPLRIVYQMQCFGQSLNETWKNLGAKAVNGSIMVNFYPNQLNKFLDEWNKGTTGFDEAVTHSNTSGSRKIVQDWIAYVSAPWCKLKPDCTGEWNGCPIGKTILGDHDCAKEFFISDCCGYFTSSQWKNGHSGEQNMDYSSQQYLTGSKKNITKNSIAKWE